METGPSCLTLPVMYISSCSLIEQRSLSSTKDTSYNISPPSGNLNTLELSPSIKLSESRSQSSTTCCCPTSTSLVTSNPCTLTTLVPPNWVECLDLQLPLPQTDLPFESVMRYAGTGTKECVAEEKVASTSTFANSVLRKNTLLTSAWWKVLWEVLDLKVRHPGWVHNLMWCDLKLALSWAAFRTEYTQPLPSVPIDKFRNKEAIRTISLFPHLFKIISPINFPPLKDLLVDHLNQLFIDSIVHEFNVGFWPFAHTHYSIYPLTVDDSGQPPNSSKQLEFLNKQIQTEVDAACYSAPFGPDLLPGMYSTPILTVPRKGKLHLCNHQSMGNSSSIRWLVTMISLELSWMAFMNLESLFNSSSLSMVMFH